MGAYMSPSDEVDGFCAKAQALFKLRGIPAFGMRKSRRTVVAFAVWFVRKVSYFLCFGLLILALCGSKAPAQEMRWQEALKASGCLTSPPSPDQLLLIVSAWEGN